MNLDTVSPGMATPEQIRPYLDLLTSLQKWALDSMAYVKRRNHLNGREKGQVRQQLEAYEYHLRGMIKGYSDHTLELQPDLVRTEMNQYLIRQAKQNRLARHYEFPRYQLPLGIYVEDYSFEQYFEVTTDAHNPILYKKDTLFTYPVYSFAQLKPADLLCVTFRRDYKHPRLNRMGWFKGIVGNNLVLAYDRPRLEVKQSDWGISLYEVVHIHKVDTISRDV